MCYYLSGGGMIVIAINRFDLIWFDLNLLDEDSQGTMFLCHRYVQSPGLLCLTSRLATQITRKYVRCPFQALSNKFRQHRLRKSKYFRYYLRLRKVDWIPGRVPVTWRIYSNTATTKRCDCYCAVFTFFFFCQVLWFYLWNLPRPPLKG